MTPKWEKLHEAGSKVDPVDRMCDNDRGRASDCVRAPGSPSMMQCLRNISPTFSNAPFMGILCEPLPHSPNHHHHWLWHWH